MNQFTQKYEQKSTEQLEKIAIETSLNNDKINQLKTNTSMIILKKRLTEDQFNKFLSEFD